ncbi:ferritin-like domain-containing protein [Oceanotoga sp. DSM 15011]|jgi:hypothetical protein|uniref:ferritin-like domain-containing protein n=1 Tax=Oceanotoga sp. DSM 15011 TaxID=2984951 RepID=UPI0021F425D7|nr:ferritin-like domain-containing protein [Oceanotoga sp. DSM 15011]UYP01070.1 ferritin-like domain-containing protein [Oceanotoga sp. DSM 15011]
MGDYHESYDALDQRTRDLTRALNSLKEEIEAVDWYNQRVALAENEELKSIMAHNRDEEIEHAVMTLEWLRRNMDGWDEEMKTYLFKEGNITDLEEEIEKGEDSKDESLGIKDMNK